MKGSKPTPIGKLRTMNVLKGEILYLIDTLMNV